MYIYYIYQSTRYFQCRPYHLINAVVILVQTVSLCQNSRYFLCRQSHRIKTIGFSFVQTARCIKTVVSFGADRIIVSKQSLFCCRPNHRITKNVIVVQIIPSYQNSRYIGTDRTTVSRHLLFWHRQYHRIKAVVSLVQTIPPYYNNHYFVSEQWLV